MENIRKFNFESWLNKVQLMFYLYILIVNYLYKKDEVPIDNFFGNWTRGTSYLTLSKVYTHPNREILLY